MSFSHGARVGFMVCCCLLLAGCVTKSTNGEEVTFRYQLWLSLGIAVVGMACIPIGLAMRKNFGAKGWVLTIAGPLAALAFAPQLYCERTRVDDDGFEINSGILGRTANCEIKFTDVKSIRIDEEVTGGRNSRLIGVLFFEFKKGAPDRVPLNNDVKIEAAKEILARAIQRGIPVK